MASTSRELLARKQRTTLRDRGTTKLIDLLRDGPTTRFITDVNLPRVRRSAPSQHWTKAFAICHGKRKDLIGRMFKVMYDNALTLQDETGWQPVRPLGNGSFGAAALFKHEDEHGNTDDFVVAKYTLARDKDMVNGWDSHISQEAAIMMQLNELDSDGILFLREFRYFPNIKANAYFTEYCPNFDFEVLSLTHKAMERKIPDALVWYLFYTLAKGLLAMEQGPFGNYATPHHHISGAYLIHRDIKPANTFIGYPSAPIQPLPSHAAGYVGAQLNYPLAKIADFGLSQITTLGETENLATNHGAGTEMWQPPEVRIRKFDKQSDWYPFRGTRYDLDGELLSENDPLEDKGSHAYTPAGNVFVVGYMMYQLITLDEPNGMHEFLNDIMSEKDSPVPWCVLNPGNLTQRYAILNELEDDLNSGAGLTDADEKLREKLCCRKDMLMRWQNTDQDPVLKQLVEHCMRFRPENRPSAANLLQQIEYILPSHLQQLIEMRQSDPGAFEQATRAFTTEADLSGMTPGNLTVSRDLLFWRRIVRCYNWLDVTAGNIRPRMDLDDPDVPKEAKEMFYPGYREEQNRLIAQHPTNTLFDMGMRGDPDVMRYPVRRDPGPHPDDGLGFGAEPLDPNNGPRRQGGPR